MIPANDVYDMRGEMEIDRSCCEIVMFAEIIGSVNKVIWRIIVQTKLRISSSSVNDEVEGENSDDHLR
jgi:hypothetical protein